MKDITREFEQYKIEKLYGDRIEKFDELGYKSGKELENGVLEILDLYMKTDKFE